jgi:hypothetical protein
VSNPPEAAPRASALESPVTTMMLAITALVTSVLVRRR